MIGRVGQADRARLAAYLAMHAETSMFLMGNLEAHGLGPSDHPHSTSYWTAERDGEIAGVLGRTNGGMLMVQAPGLDAEGAGCFLAALSGRPVRGITGDDAQAAAVIAAMNLPAEAWQLNATEPLYALSLAGLAVPEAEARAPGTGDRALLVEWFSAYMIETDTRPEGDLWAEARRRADAALGGRDVHLLIEGGRPVAMSGINARAGQAVQIGGVYVPPGLRGQGRAGRAVAAQLAAARDGGARTAILFAGSAPAARAYERIGFERIGAYRVALLHRAAIVGGQP